MRSPFCAHFLHIRLRQSVVFHALLPSYAICHWCGSMPALPPGGFTNLLDRAPSFLLCCPNSFSHLSFPLLSGWKLLALVFCCGAFLGLLLLSALGGDRWAVPSSVQSTGVATGRQGGRNLPSPTFGPDGRPTWYGRIKPKQMVATPREAFQWAAKESLWEKVSILTSRKVTYIHRNVHKEVRVITSVFRRFTKDIFSVILLAASTRAICTTTAHTRPALQTFCNAQLFPTFPSDLTSSGQFDEANS